MAASRRPDLSRRARRGRPAPRPTTATTRPAWSRLPLGVRRSLVATTGRRIESPGAVAPWTTECYPRRAAVGGRRSRPGGGRTPRVGAAAQAASGSRPWRRRRGGRARRWRPPRGWWPGRGRAAARIAPAAPRSAGPALGRARSSPNQGIEHEFDTESGMVLTATSRSPPSVAALGPRTGGTWRSAAVWRRRSWDANAQERALTRQRPYRRL